MLTPTGTVLTLRSPRWIHFDTWRFPIGGFLARAEQCVPNNYSSREETAKPVPKAKATTTCVMVSIDNNPPCYFAVGS